MKCRRRQRGKSQKRPRTSRTPDGRRRLGAMSDEFPVHIAPFREPTTAGHRRSSRSEPGLVIHLALAVPVFGLTQGSLALHVNDAGGRVEREEHTLSSSRKHVRFECGHERQTTYDRVEESCRRLTERCPTAASRSPRCFPPARRVEFLSPDSDDFRLPWSVRQYRVPLDAHRKIEPGARQMETVDDAPPRTRSCRGGCHRGGRRGRGGARAARRL